MRAGMLIALLLARAAGLAAQASPADSAKTLLAAAVQASAGSTPEGYRQAILLRRQAVQLLHGLGDRRGEGEALSLTAAAWYQLGEPDSSRRYAQEAFPLRLAAGDTAGAVRSLAGVLGPSFEALGQADSAIATYHLALGLARLTRDPLVEAQPAQNLAGLYANLSRADSAFAWYHATIALSHQGGDFRTEGEVLNNFAAIYDDLGNPDSALAYAREALRIGRTQRSDTLVAASLQNLGVIFVHQSSADSALFYNRLAYQAAERTANPQGQRQVLHNIGVALDLLGQGDSAAFYFRQTVRRAREAKDGSTEAKALNSLGIYFKDHGQLDSAALAYRLVLELHRGLQNRRGEGIAFLNLAAIYAEQELQDSSLSAARMAYVIAQETQFPALESAANNAIGHVFAQRRQWDSALVYLQRDLATSRQLHDVSGEGITLLMMGLVFQGQRDFAHATAYFDSTAAAKARVALHAGGDFNRTTLGEREFELYEAWARAWLARTEELGASAATLGALAATERGRAQALLDLMDRASDSSAVSADLLQWGRGLVAGVTRDGSALLVYQVAGDTLFAWTASPTRALRVHRIGLGRDSLAALVAGLRRGLGIAEGGAQLAARGAPLERGVRGTSTPSATAWQRPAAALGAAVLPAAVREELEGSREILLVPQGVLALVPFSALPWGASGPPLGSRIALRYSPSLATAVAADARAKPASPLRAALVVGNPFMPAVQTSDSQRMTLGSLPGAEAEARAVAVRLGAAPLEGKAATETVVRSRLPDAALVHLATHGYAYATEGQARNSFVAFAPDSLNDGVLTVAELLDDPRLTLHADLVTLSACQTGLGDLKQAEGTVGLQRAFLARGARSVLVSLWNVSDLATRNLMERFYQHLLQDADHPSKAEALRRSQLEVQAQPGFSHPRFWAAFQLVGAR